jgi:hypothetical protein
LGVLRRTRTNPTTARSPILNLRPRIIRNLEMAPSPLQQRRTHNTLLFQKLLNLREHGTSPFTLVLDSLEQSGGPLIREFARRGKVRVSCSVSSRLIACYSVRAIQVYCSGVAFASHLRIGFAVWESLKKFTKSRDILFVSFH